jgi:hypothetical protein
MKKHIMRMAAFAAFASIVSLGAFAQKASVTYVEGTTNIKSSAGSLRAADFGSQVTYGESVITGKDGQAELKLENGSTIRVAENSVFSYSNVGTGKESRQVLATTVGKVAYKLNKATGKPPVIQSNSMVAGVRGTEFTVLAGRDGSSLIEVTGGIVDVESQGKLVTLVKDEGVEVAPGKAPGAKYTRPGRELDFSDWNKGKTDAFLADPVAGLAAVDAQLAVYQKSLEELKKPYADATAAWKQAAVDYKPIRESKDEAAIKKFQDERLSPAQDNRAAIILTIRYHALNYLSMRRFVMSNMYMEMKSRYPGKRPANVETFFKNYAAMLAKYEDGIVPELNKNDY